jgi:hypothetical protein
MTLRTLSVTIPAGKSVSDALDCSGAVRIVRLIMPPAWTKAPLTFCMSPDDTVYHDLYHVTPGSLASYEVTVPIVTPDAVLAFPPTTGTVVAWFKIRSGTHAAPVVQAAARTFQVVVEEPDEANVVEGPTGPKGAAGSAGPTGATGPAATVTAATGPTGGYMQVGNIITQWGSLVATTGAGTTVNFPRPYTDGPPSVTASAAAGGTLQVSATKTSITVSCNSGTPVVSWKAIGS